MEADSQGGTIYLKLTPLLKSWAVRGETGQNQKKNDPAFTGSTSGEGEHKKQRLK